MGLPPISEWSVVWLEKVSEKPPLPSFTFSSAFHCDLHFTEIRSKAGQGQIFKMPQLQPGLIKEVPLHLPAPTLEIMEGPKWEPKIFDSKMPCKPRCSMSAQHLLSLPTSCLLNLNRPLRAK